MSVFKNYAHKYYERGLSVIPIRLGEKAPAISAWSTYCERLPTEYEMDLWASISDAGIGLCLGPASNIICVDFDNDIDNAHAKIEALIPRSPIKKKGAVGFSGFYRYSGEETKKWNIGGRSIIEILSTGRQTLLPPSSHPSGGNYIYLTPDTFENFLSTDLPTLPPEIYNWIDKILGTEKKIAPIITQRSYEPAGEAEIENALRFISPDSYDTWLGIGMGLKAELGDRGFYLWDRWSSNSNKYKGDEMAGKWASFNSAGISIKTLFHHAIEGGYVSPPRYADIKLVELDLEPGIPGVEEKPPLSDIMLTPPGLVGQIYRWILSTSIQPQPLLALAAAIPAVGVVMGHKVRSETNLRTNMLTLGLAPSGAGKNHPINCIVSLFKAAGIDALQGGTPVSGAGLLCSLRDGSGRRLVQIDEMGRVLKSLTSRNAMAHQSDILTNIMMLFSKANTMFYGSEYVNHGGKTPRKDIEQPCLCVFGATVPSRFYQSLTSEEAIDGFLARWLIFETKDAGDEELEGGDIDEPPSELTLAVMNWERQPTNFYLKEGAGNLESDFIKPRIISLSADANAILAEYKSYTKKEKAKAIKEGRGLDAIWARAKEHAIKLALCGHEDGEISAAVMEWAIAVVNYSVANSIASIQTRLSDNQQEADTKWVLAIIAQHHNGIKKAALTKRTWRLQGRSRNDILNSLMESGAIETVSPKSEENQFGPKTIIFRAIN